MGTGWMFDLDQISASFSSVAMTVANLVGASASESTVEGFSLPPFSGSSFDHISPISSASTALPPSGSSALFSPLLSSFSPSSLRHFGSFLQMMWLPLTVWLLSMITCTWWIRYHRTIPRTLSPRGGILLSQGIFTLFWIILGAVQEVQERLMLAYKVLDHQRTSRATLWDDEPSFSHSSAIYSRYHGSALLETPLNHPHQSTWMTMTHWIGDGQAQEAQSLSFEQALEQPCILSVLTPLTVVQYMAIILLGVATGLLTTGSANLEVQLDKEQDNLHQKQDQQRQQGHQEKTCLLLIDYEEEEEKDSTNDQLRALESSIESGSKSWLGPTTLRRGLTLKQRLGLCLWVLILFSSQIWFFQWIVTNGSLPTLSTAGAEGSVVSTSLTLFGLFSGTVMIALGTMLL
ncbi:hypothetical protein B0O80DRAFT_461343 [Mortierella sp. GBAus27b]|nr:hypothetical protein B0O80DRAFT_461343 [Mortierella sp. GBAus27b]